MPVILPIFDAATGELNDTRHWQPAEVAEMFRCSETWIRKMCRLPITEGGWEHLRLGKNLYLSDRQLGLAIEAQTRNAHLPTDPPPRLGTVINPDDLEPI